MITRDLARITAAYSSFPCQRPHIAVRQHHHDGIELAPLRLVHRHCLGGDGLGQLRQWKPPRLVAELGTRDERALHLGSVSFHLAPHHADVAVEEAYPVVIAR